MEVSDKDHNPPNPFSPIDIIEYEIENQTDQPDSDYVSLYNITRINRNQRGRY